MKATNFPSHAKRLRFEGGRSFDKSSGNSKSSERAGPLGRKCCNADVDLPQFSFLKDRKVSMKLGSFKAKITGAQKENGSLEGRMSAGEPEPEIAPGKKPRGRAVSPLPADPLTVDRQAIRQSLVSAQVKYRGPISETVDGGLVNQLCVNHSDRKSEFFVDSGIQHEARIGVCPSCGVKLASYQFQVAELVTAEVPRESESKLKRVLGRAEKLERVNREKEELLKCSNLSLKRSFEAQRRKLDKLFELLAAVIDKKRQVFEETLREQFQVEKAKLQHKFFQIQQAKQTLSQIRVGLGSGEAFQGVEETAEFEESLSLFDGIFQESETLYDSVEFVSFSPFDDFSIKEIVDKIESSIAIEACIRLAPIDPQNIIKTLYPDFQLGESALGQSDLGLNGSFQLQDSPEQAKDSPEKTQVSTIRITDQGAGLSEGKGG